MHNNNKYPGQDGGTENPFKRVGVILIYLITMKTFSELKRRNILSNEAMLSLKGGTPSGTCGYVGSDGQSECNINKEYALFMHDWVGGRWCCDSCPQTDYCGNA